MSNVKAGVLSTEAGVGAGTIAAILTLAGDLPWFVVVTAGVVAIAYTVCRTVLKVKA